MPLEGDIHSDFEREGEKLSEKNEIENTENQVKNILREILEDRDFHPLETMARYELQCEIIDKIKNNDYFASLLLKSMNEDSIMNTPKYILETLRDKSIQNLKYFENILIASSHYDFIWKNFIKN
ncbi:MAG: hypothetical protein ACPHY8_04735 [Patescibacteria group bacterium]